MFIAFKQAICSSFSHYLAKSHKNEFFEFFFNKTCILLTFITFIEAKQHISLVINNYNHEYC